VPGLFLGTSTAELVIDHNFRRYLGDDYGAQARHEAKLGRRGARTTDNRVMWTAIAGALLLAFVMAKHHACFTETTVEIRPFLALHDSRYRYSDIVAIHTAPAFVAPGHNLVQRREYSFHFADGSRWTTDDGLSGATQAEETVLAAFVSARSGRPVESLPVLDRSEF
jgi:hypothetical protein